jgi:hypothetical protein
MPLNLYLSLFGPNYSLLYTIATAKVDIGYTSETLSMPQSLIDFEWWRPRVPGGHRLTNRKVKGLVFYHPPRRPVQLPALRGQWGFAYHPLGIGVLQSSDGMPCEPAYVVATSDDFVRYRPLDAFSSLFIQFAKLTTADQVLHFIERFGGLTQAGRNEKGELVEGVLAHSFAMRELLAYADDPDRKADLLQRQVNPFSELDVTLDIDPSGVLTHRFVPGSLLDALWLQAVQALNERATVRECLQCGNLFQAGIGTGRRLDAKFCSEEHKTKFHSLKRSREK